MIFDSVVNLSAEHAGRELFQEIYDHLKFAFIEIENGADYDVWKLIPEQLRFFKNPFDFYINYNPYEFQIMLQNALSAIIPYFPNWTTSNQYNPPLWSGKNAILAYLNESKINPSPVFLSAKWAEQQFRILDVLKMKNYIAPMAFIDFIDSKFYTKKDYWDPIFNKYCNGNTTKEFLFNYKKTFYNINPPEVEYSDFTFGANFEYPNYFISNVDFEIYGNFFQNGCFDFDKIQNLINILLGNFPIKNRVQIILLQYYYDYNYFVFPPWEAATPLPVLNDIIQFFKQNYPYIKIAYTNKLPKSKSIIWPKWNKTYIELASRQFNHIEIS